MSLPLEGSRDIHDGIIISIVPDICLTPAGGGMVPVPYTIWCRQADAGNLANSVRQTDDRSHAVASIVQHCYGDEPGTGGGIDSGTTGSECTPKTWSRTVRAEGRNMVRHLDQWWMNHKNTYGLLFYTKDMGIYTINDPDTISSQMGSASSTFPSTGLTQPQKAQLAQASNTPAGPVANDAGPTPVTAGQQYALVDENNGYLAPIDPLDPGATLQEPPGTTYKDHQLHKAERGLGLALGLAFAYYYYEHLRVSQKEEGKCPCIVGTYKSVKPKCSAAGCGGQAHHIVADKYLRTGTRPASGVVDPNRIKNMPSLDDGPSICLNGNAGDEDSDHNIAHQNDGLIQSLGDQSNPKGTLPIGTIRGLSVSAAKAAAPPDAACQSQIDNETGIDKYGGNPSALVRSTNNPPAAGSPAMNYFTGSKPIR